MGEKMPKLRVLDSTSHGPKPARSLGPHGFKLWTDVFAEVDIDDAASVETFLQCCQQLDRAELLRERILKTGEFIETRNGEMKDNPLLRHELQARQFVVNNLRKLGLTLEPVKPQGRPPMKGYNPNAD
jgi:hypothetical protein